MGYYSKKTIEKVRRMAGECVNDNAIAAQLNVDPRTIRNIRRKYDIKSGLEDRKEYNEKRLANIWKKAKDLDEAAQIWGKKKQKTLDDLRRLHADKKINLPDHLLIGNYFNHVVAPSKKSEMEKRITKSKETLLRIKNSMIKSHTVRQYLQTGEWPEMGNA